MKTLRAFYFPWLVILVIFSIFSCDFSFGKEDEEEPASWDVARPLREIYQSHFMVGNIIRNTGDFTNADRFGILSRHYNIVTAENNMKPENLAPSTAPASAAVNWNYQFSTADTIVNKANEARFAVHGHTLVWHTQSPAWLAAGGEEYLVKFVTDVVEHYKGKVISWDVVNEAMKDGIQASEASGEWKHCLRYGPWNQSIGYEYIEKAFLAARAADPAAKLFYNDYNLNDEHKARAVYNMVHDINSRFPNEEGRPLIDGIGMQTHHHLKTNPQTVRASIQLFASLGVEIAISEMDILAADGGEHNMGMGSWSDSNAQLQAKQYAAMFRIFIDNSQHISRVIFWGLDDGTSWRKANCPTLLDKNYGPKPAFHAVSNPGKY